MIENIKNCTGCHACYSICKNGAITMDADKEGFLHPVVDYKKCNKCGECLKVCPLLKKRKLDKSKNAFAAINKNYNTRLKSSSGGIFTILAESIINNSGVVFGALFDNNFNIKHDYINNINDVHKLQGSKYVQSTIGNSYKSVEKKLKENKLVLFSGTPCQIDGLLSFLKKDYKNLICVDFICHGVPSPLVWKKYLEEKKRKYNSKIHKISFRNKNKGWKDFSIKIIFKNNLEYIKKFRDDAYMKGFLRNLYLRKSCYNCQSKGLNRKSDITLADFWGINNILPNINDDKGVSLVILNNQKGEKLFEKIKEKIYFYKVNINDAIKYNPMSIKSAPKNKKRRKFFKKMNHLPIEKLVNKYCKPEKKIYKNYN